MYSGTFLIPLLSNSSVLWVAEMLAGQQWWISDRLMPVLVTSKSHAVCELSFAFFIASVVVSRTAYKSAFIDVVRWLSDYWLNVGLLVRLLLLLCELNICLSGCKLVTAVSSVAESCVILLVLLSFGFSFILLPFTVLYFLTEQPPFSYKYWKCAVEDIVCKQFVIAQITVLSEAHFVMKLGSCEQTFSW